eukprot:snap_masked-scaffold_11-processed-gene-6.31-mRNA-1 protein AED:1.00 eAED:1.00 QI:0/0/0/0/1/1/2/0/88
MYWNFHIPVRFLIEDEKVFLFLFACIVFMVGIFHSFFPVSRVRSTVAFLVGTGFRCSRDLIITPIQIFESDTIIVFIIQGTKFSRLYM